MSCMKSLPEQRKKHQEVRAKVISPQKEGSMRARALLLLALPLTLRLISLLLLLLPSSKPKETSRIDTAHSLTQPSLAAVLRPFLHLHLLYSGLYACSLLCFSCLPLSHSLLLVLFFCLCLVFLCIPSFTLIGLSLSQFKFRVVLYFALVCSFLVCLDTVYVLCSHSLHSSLFLRIALLQFVHSVALLFEFFAFLWFASHFQPAAQCMLFSFCLQRCVHRFSFRVRCCFTVFPSFAVASLSFLRSPLSGLRLIVSTFCVLHCCCIAFYSVLLFELYSRY